MPLVILLASGLYCMFSICNLAVRIYVVQTVGSVNVRWRAWIRRLHLGYKSTLLLNSIFRESVCICFTKCQNCSASHSGASVTATLSCCSNV